MRKTIVVATFIVSAVSAGIETSRAQDAVTKSTPTKLAAIAISCGDEIAGTLRIRGRRGSAAKLEIRCNQLFIGSCTAELPANPQCKVVVKKPPNAAGDQHCTITILKGRPRYFLNCGGIMSRPSRRT